MATIKYMALSYYSSPVTDENMTIGIMFHNVENDARTFNYISNFHRFHAFDDEVSVDVLKDLLASTEREIQPNSHDDNEEFSLEAFRKPYVNGYRFSDVSTTNTRNPERFVKTYAQKNPHVDTMKGPGPMAGSPARYAAVA